VINVGSAVAVPGATGLQLKVLSIAGGHAELEVLDSENGGGRVSATGGTELVYPTPSGTYLFRTDAVQPSSVTQSFIAVGESLLTFRSVIALDSGVLGVLVGSEAESSFLEVWQKVGTGYVKRSRTAMPRTDAVKKIEVSQPSVLAVHDASGFYEVPYSLSYSGTVVTGVSLGSVVTRPSTLAGQSVLEWNCD
jgi:hypothetical protein